MWHAFRVLQLMVMSVSFIPLMFSTHFLPLQSASMCSHSFSPSEPCYQPLTCHWHEPDVSPSRPSSAYLFLLLCLSVLSLLLYPPWALWDIFLVSSLFLPSPFLSSTRIFHVSMAQWCNDFQGLDRFDSFASLGQHRRHRSQAKPRHSLIDIVAVVTDIAYWSSVLTLPPLLPLSGSAFPSYKRLLISELTIWLPVHPLPSGEMSTHISSLQNLSLYPWTAQPSVYIYYLPFRLLPQNRLANLPKVEYS